jgi:hypothetical protein
VTNKATRSGATPATALSSNRAPAIDLPEGSRPPVWVVATCAAEALHPAPDAHNWRFWLSKLAPHPISGYTTSGLTEDDWAKLNALFGARGLSSLGPDSPHNLSPEDYEPYKQAVHSDSWGENWRPTPEFSSDRNDALTRQRISKDEHKKALHQLVKVGAIDSLTEYGALASPGNGTDLIRRVDAVAYLQRCGHEVVQCNANAGEQPVGALADGGPKVKRAALIERNRGKWPTIERDLKDAAENGLSSSAKADGRGWWLEGAALAWADVRGKLSDQGSKGTALDRIIHRM